MKKTYWKQIWRKPMYLPYLQPELSPALVQWAEEKMGFKLPEAYLELLKQQNGGYIRFTLEDTPHNKLIGIGPNYPSITAFEWLSEYSDLSFSIEGLFPFDGDGHWNICLDYRNNSNEPEVTYIDTEMDFERAVAATFEEYLEALVYADPYDLSIETDLSLDELLVCIEDVVENAFSLIDPKITGYTKYKNLWLEQWFWLMPNKVPLGYVRENDKRFEELKSQMLLPALRCPEFGEQAYILSFMEKEQSESLLPLLKAKGLKVSKIMDAFV